MSKLRWLIPVGLLLVGGFMIFPTIVRADEVARGYYTGLDVLIWIGGLFMIAMGKLVGIIMLGLWLDDRMLGSEFERAIADNQNYAKGGKVE